jgi:acyl-CoA thioester hydrolase
VIAVSFSTETKIRVRYADTDQMKMVYYGKFFEYFEQSRSDLLREIGLPYPEIEKMGYFLPVIEAHASYMRAARYDDLIVVRPTLEDMPQVRVRISYEVWNDETNVQLATGYTVHSFVNALSGKPARAPEHFLELVGRSFKKSGKT